MTVCAQLAPPADPHAVYLDLPGTLRYLNVLSACIHAILERADNLADPDTLIPQIQLAVQETCTNIVQHAYAGRTDGRIVVTLTLAQDPQRLIVNMRDTGCPFDPAGVPPPALGTAQVHGYGIYLIHKLMNEVSYCSAAGANHWRLVKVL